MAGIVQVGVQSMADRYAYIPFIGLFIAICWGVTDALQLPRIPRFAGAVAGVIALIALSVATSLQLGYWGDNLRLWDHTLQVTRSNFVAEDSMAMALVVQGRTEDAVQHFRNAVRINPRDPIGNLNLGVYEQGRGDYPTSIAHYNNVFGLTSNPRLRTSAFANRGSAYYALKQYDQAKQSYEAALREFPENSQAFLRAWTVGAKGREHPSSHERLHALGSGTADRRWLPFAGADARSRRAD